MERRGITRILRGSGGDVTDTQQAGGKRGKERDIPHTEGAGGAVTDTQLAGGKRGEERDILHTEGGWRG